MSSSALWAVMNMKWNYSSTSVDLFVRNCVVAVSIVHYSTTISILPCGNFQQLAGLAFQNFYQIMT